MTHEPDDLDDDLLALLREQGIDPEAVRSERRRMAQSTLSPQEAAKLAADQAELREATEAYFAYHAANGSLTDHVRDRARSRT